MAKQQHRHNNSMKHWLEVAPSVLDFPWKPSTTCKFPRLEPILEDNAEEYADDDEDED